MKLFSLILVSLVSAYREYECGERYEPHFHHYRNQDFWGHFKIGNERYRIAKPLPNEDEAHTSRRRDLCAQAKKAIDIFGKSDKGNRIRIKN